MIVYSQQIREILKGFEKFNNKPEFMDERTILRAKRHLREHKLENLTLENFRYILLFLLYKKKPINPIKLYEALDEVNENEVKSAMKLKREFETSTYLIEEGKKLHTDTATVPFILYKKGSVSLFYVDYYYNLNPDKIKGRIMSKNLKDIKTVVNFFKGME